MLGLGDEGQNLFQPYNCAHFAAVDWMNKNLRLLAIVFIYFSIILGAFQVGLTLEHLQNSRACTNAAYVFAVLCMVLCLLAFLYGMYTSVFVVLHALAGEQG